MIQANRRRVPFCFAVAGLSLPLANSADILEFQGIPAPQTDAERRQIVTSPPDHDRWQGLFDLISHHPTQR